MVEQDKLLPPVTLHSLFGLSSDKTVTGLAPLKAAIVDSPLWIVLLVVAAIPYALAAHQFFKEKPAGEGGS